MSTFDVLTATLKDLQDLLQAKKCTSVELIHIYLAEIERNNHKGLDLHAVIETAPQDQLIQIAQKLDDLRSSGTVLSPIHGIPLLIKDNIGTDDSLGMKTTAGSHALADSVVKEDATVIKRLRDQGAIILGKANMTEWACFREEWIKDEDFGGCRVNGWSGRGGATKAAYSTDMDPSGSSTGSAVAVSAGFAPAALGSETCGPLISPASKAALYTIKPSTGLISGAGCIPISSTLDRVGPMAKTAYDAALLLQLISGPDPKDEKTLDVPREEDYVKYTTDATFKGKRLGFIRASEEAGRWQVRGIYAPEIIENTNHALDRMRELGAEVIPVDFDRSGADKVEAGFDLVLATDFKVDIAKYLGDLAKTSVHTLEDVIKFNDEHPELEKPAEHPEQANLIVSQDTLGKDDPKYIEALRACREWAGSRFDSLIATHKLDALVACSSEIPWWDAAACSYPCVNVPYGYLSETDEPYGICFIGPPYSEPMLIELMAASETAFPPRKVPSPLAS